MEREIVLDENVHSSEILKNFNSMRNKKMQCDFIVRAGEEEMPVHKLVLSAGSDYFKAMLAHNTKESQAGVVVVKEMNPVCVKKCIEFIYTGTGSVSDENREELMHAAHMMQLQRLCDGIAIFLENELCPDSFIVTRRIAHMFSCQNLKEHCNTFALHNFCALASSHDFKSLDPDYVSFLMASKNANASVADKCKALIIWTQHVPDSRVSFFENNFKTLDFAQLRFEYVKYLVENESLVYNTVACWRPLMFKSYKKENVVAKDHDWTGRNQYNVLAAFDKTSKSIQGFDPEKKEWKQMQRITDEIAAKEFVAVVLKTDLYVLGYDRSCYVLSNYSDPSATWARISDRASNGRLRAVACQGSIYAFGDTMNSSKAVEKLPSSSESWLQFTNKPVSAWECAIVATEDSIFCFGGYNNSITLTHSLKLDPNIPKWHTLPDMPSKRCGACAAEIGEKIFVIGGTPSPGRLKTCQYLDLTTEAWVAVANTNFPRYWFSACAFENKIYVCGGSNEGDAIEEYDATENTWKIVGSTSGKQIVNEAAVALYSPT